MTSTRTRVLALPLALTVLTVGGCSASDPGPAPSVSREGFGGLTVLQSSITDVERTLGLGSSFPAPQTEYCSLVIFETDGVAVTATDAGVVLAFVLQNSAVTTGQGIRVGSTVDDLTAAYGSALTVHRRVSPTGGPVVLVDDGSPDQESHLAFDLDPDGRVARIRIGALPWVGYTDYCSDSASRPRSTGWPL